MFTSGDWSIWTIQPYVTTVGVNADVPVTSSLMAVSVTNDLDSITGFNPPMEYSGGALIVANAHATNTLVFTANDASSQAGHRIVLPDGSSQLKLPPGHRAQFIYTVGVGFKGGREGVFNAPVVSSAGPISTTPTTNGAGFTFTTGTQPDSMVTLLNQLRSIAIADGKMT